MSDFDKAVAVVFAHEGGYANAKHDAGGPTNMGITLETMKAALGPAADLDGDGDVDAADVRLLTREQALAIYRERYWNRPGLWAIKDQVLATKVFDLGVNAGPAVGVALLQKAINVARPAKKVEPVKVDGRLGSRTLTALDACDPEVVLGAMRSEQRCFYLAIVERHPEKACFLHGWLDRAGWPEEGRTA